MQLDQLIRTLEAESDLGRVVRYGFKNAQSYRGDYSELAFAPALDMTVQFMLDCAKGAVDKTYTGYKGGEFTMHEWTDCHLAEYGCSGEALDDGLLGFMLGHDFVPSAWSHLEN